jgi:hypothetical protein
MPGKTLRTPYMQPSARWLVKLVPRLRLTAAGQVPAVKFPHFLFHGARSQKSFQRISVMPVLKSYKISMLFYLTPSKVLKGDLESLCVP